MTLELTLEVTIHDRTRLAYLRHESEIKSIGQLCYLVTSSAGLAHLRACWSRLASLEHPHELDEALCLKLHQAAVLGLLGVMLRPALAHFALAHRPHSPAKLGQVDGGGTDRV